MNVPSAVEQRSTFEPAPRLGWTVVSAKIRAARNRAAVTRRRSPVLTGVQYGIVAPATIGFTALLTVGFASTFDSVTDGRFAMALLAAALTVGAIGSFIGSSTAALQALYLADDIPFLLTLPIPLRVLFASKFVEAAAGAAPPALLMFSAAAGFGFAHSSPAAYWLLAPAVLLTLVVLATSVAVVVVSAVTRYIPPRRARIFLLAISMGVIAATFFGWQLLAPRPTSLGNAIEKSDYEPLWRAVAWTPAGWGAKGLSDASRGQLTSALPLVALQVAAAAVFVAFACTVFRRSFIRGLVRTTAVQHAAPSPSTTAWLTSIARLFPRPYGALVLREWLLIFRDLKRLSGAVWPMGMVVVYAMVLGRGGSDFTSERLAFWSKNGSLALLPWGLSLGLSVYAFGGEGRNIDLLRSLPASARTIFFAKVLASLVPVAVGSVAIAAASLWLRRAALVPSLELLAVVVWMVAGFVAIDTSASALAPNFEASNIQRSIALAGRLYGFALGGLFGLSTFAAVGRLVLYDADYPARWNRVVEFELGGVEPLGWPLVIGSGGVAVGAATIAVALAVRQTNRLLELTP